MPDPEAVQLKNQLAPAGALPELTHETLGERDEAGRLVVGPVVISEAVQGDDAESSTTRGRFEIKEVGERSPEQERLIEMSGYVKKLSRNKSLTGDQERFVGFLADAGSQQLEALIRVGAGTLDMRHPDVASAGSTYKNAAGTLIRRRHGSIDGTMQQALGDFGNSAEATALVLNHAAPASRGDRVKSELRPQLEDCASSVAVLLGNLQVNGNVGEIEAGFAELNAYLAGPYERAQANAELQAA